MHAESRKGDYKIPVVQHVEPMLCIVRNLPREPLFGASRRKEVVCMIDESALTKGQARKLNALRRSLGPAIADEAFAKWLDQAVEAPEADSNAQVISDALWAMVQEGKVTIRRGGYIVRRGRGRVIVEASGD